LQPHANAVRLSHTANEGPESARDLNIQATRGDYISCLDSDEPYRLLKLGFQSALLDVLQHIGMVYTEFSGFSGAGFSDESHLHRY